MELTYISIRQYPSRLTIYFNETPALRYDKPSRVSCIAEAEAYAQKALMDIIDRVMPTSAERVYCDLRDIYCRMIA